MKTVISLLHVHVYQISILLLQIMSCNLEFLAGMKTVSQRCRFVTSSYREMVLSAIDFRNRFAERPYLCEELIEPDQVVV